MVRRKSKTPEDKYRPKASVTTQRHGDLFVTVTVEVGPAIIDFNDILASCTVEPDDDTPAPWEDCDGWEHETYPLSKIEDDPGWGHEEKRTRTVTRITAVEPAFCPGEPATPENDCGQIVPVEETYYEWIPHYNKDHVARVGGRRLLIVVPWETAVEWQGKEPARGGSRQRFREHVAEHRKKAIEQLIRWYEDGWQYWWVSCNFMDYQASVGGGMVDDDEENDPYILEVKEDIAEEVAGQMEKDGYTVINRPENDYNSRAAKQKRLRWKIAYNLGLHDPDTYVAWLAERGPRRDLITKEKA